MVRDLIAAKAPPELIEEMRAVASAVHELEVLHENVPAVEMFFRMQTQWRLAPMGGLIGLDYTAVCAAMTCLRIKKPAIVFDGMQTIERAALNTFAKQRERAP